MSDNVHPTAPRVADTSKEGKAGLPLLRATCWGTRGSIPSPGPATARFGGNTSCLEVRSADDRCFIFDAGTGIRILGRRLLTEPGPTEADLFLSHFHWDHIQGFPLFEPLYSAETKIRLHGARQPPDLDIETLMRGQMGPVYFPVPFEALAAELSFHHLNGEAWVDDVVTVSAIRVRHPAHTYGYRIQSGDAALAYIPDNELFGGSYPVGGEDWYRGLLSFLDGVDVLFHDAMFTDEEYENGVEGWGHSTFTQAIKLAGDAGVSRLFVFHHAPERIDTELLAIIEREREAVANRGSKLELGIASEGEELLVQER